MLTIPQMHVLGRAKKYLLTWFRSDKLNHFYDNWLPIFLYNTPLIDKSGKNIFGLGVES